MRKLIIVLTLLTATNQLNATGFEFPKDSTKKKCQVWNENHYIDMSLSGGDGIFNASIQWDKLFSVTWKKRIKIGFGIRANMTNYWNNSMNTAFYNRPSSPEFDTLLITQQTSFSVNLMFVADISLVKWMDAGLNIDLVGASFGEKTGGTVYSQGTEFSNPEPDVQPQILNAFLFGRNDRGSTNSQFYLRFWPSNDFFIKGGFSIYHITQRSPSSPSPYGDLFFSAHNMGFISFGWTPGRNEWIKKKDKL